jgi:hypothetical protein
MVKYKTRADEYKALFVRLHKYQRKGADNLIMLLIRLIRGKADYMSKYIDVVAERTGVSPTGHITTTNKDVMIPIVKEVVHIEEGIYPLDKDINKAWEVFMELYRNNLIKL